MGRKITKVNKGWICPYCKEEHLQISPFCEKYDEGIARAIKKEAAHGEK